MAPGTCGGQGRDRTGDLPLFRRTLVPTELPGQSAGPVSRGKPAPCSATLTGLEPATSAVTGRRANQLRHRALLARAIVPARYSCSSTPNGIRTRATAVKGRGPRPLDDGGRVVNPPPTAVRWERRKHTARPRGVPKRLVSRFPGTDGQSCADCPCREAVGPHARQSATAEAVPVGGTRRLHPAIWEGGSTGRPVCATLPAKVMSASAQPRLAGRQPSHRGGVPRVRTWSGAPSVRASAGPR